MPGHRTILTLKEPFVDSTFLFFLPFELVASSMILFDFVDSELGNEMQGRKIK